MTDTPRRLAAVNDPDPDPDQPPPPAVDEDLLATLHEARRQLAAAMDQIDGPGPLPEPSRYVPPNNRGVTPGAHWDIDRPRDGWAPRPRPITVIAALEDVGTADPPVYTIGIGSAFADDLDAISGGTAHEFALALLAARAMAGSRQIATRCTEAAKGRRP